MIADVGDQRFQRLEHIAICDAQAVLLLNGNSNFDGIQRIESEHRIRSEQRRICRQRIGHRDGNIAGFNDQLDEFVLQQFHLGSRISFSRLTHACYAG